ncbi:glycoside hydrolase family 31 protein [Simiduia curdlanivorans]|uniref:TIM-barrel domain-containing protein n=1 Tax=Simiduia curdlanivorans TaxID=1492769 RepID=A0ABV8V3H4_9GAMM|nr:TIM-barrel domain-containing protein [Simiduia curdlanivorans]MDN3638221.1 glycoside hydrolase family 31 protein [Simiduia curdlanivorans]
MYLIKAKVSTQRVFLALAGLAFSLTVSADFGSYQNHSVVEQTLALQTDQGELAITLHNPQAMEVFYQPNKVKQLPSFALAKTPIQATKPHLSSTKEQLHFGSDQLTVVVNKNPITLSYLRHGKPLVKEESGLFVHDAIRGFRFSLNADEKILGGGQRVMGMDRRGQRMPLYNKAHYGYETESQQMYFGLPAVLSSNKYIIVFDNSATGNLDIGATEESVLQFEAVGGRTSYLIVSGDSYPHLIDGYTQLTGRQPLPPRWAFGNFASRFGYHSEQEVRDTVKKFRDQDFPLDALVLDLYWFGKDIKGHMGNLAWDKEAFPEPTKMIQDLKTDGVNTILITEPFILTSSKRWQEAKKADVLATNAHGEPKTFNFYFGNTALIDVFHKPAQAWFWSIYQELMLQGVAGWWGDLGEPEVHPDDSIHRLDNQIATGNEIHNAYGHEWAKMVYENQRRRFPNTRPMVMMRSGFAGSQRYGFIPWTGDVSRSWGGLKPQVELSLQMSLLGLGYTHSDLGGFAGGEKFDKELYIRWLQYGVFQPVFRPHAQENIAPEPVFHDENTQDILRPFVKLRYKMLPYNYTLAFENSSTGMPLMRPLFFENEADSSLINNADSYLWGDAFLVTPITEAGVESVSVNLPEGVWFDYFTGQRYVGGKTIQQKTTLETFPVLVRAGSFIPMTQATKSTSGYSSKDLELHYYFDKTLKDSFGKMYEDDGKNPSALANGDYELLNFEAQHQRRRTQILLSRTHSYSQAVAIRQVSLIVHNLSKKPRGVTVDDHEVEFSYDGQSQQLTVEVDWSHSNTAISLHQ